MASANAFIELFNLLPEGDKAKVAKHLQSSIADVTLPIPSEKVKFGIDLPDIFLPENREQLISQIWEYHIERHQKSQRGR